MSDYQVISAVSKALRTILWSDFEQDPVLRDIVGNETAIVLLNPTETAKETANRLSLWLYQIAENEYVKNQPALRANGPETATPAPLALNLYYLLTPFATSGESDHLLLGRALRVFYDNAIVLLRDPVENIVEELHIVLSRLTLEELTRVWEALREPYRLSVGYQVRLARVDSNRRTSNARVIERDAWYGTPGAVMAAVAP
ncbi:DUF4255 domain-containing protein [Actinoplanes sp. NPDC051861]|uniref:DUF4255 domain-containing protein n=1 Tax=Actinoplanes sp. NPDC051861 TaxID=3155170 RepID=UPI003439E556